MQDLHRRTILVVRMMIQEKICFGERLVSRDCQAIPSPDLQTNIRMEGEMVPVVLVEKRHTKVVKDRLKSLSQLNKDFRVVSLENGTAAIPFLGERLQIRGWPEVDGFDDRVCMYSSSKLGNHRTKTSDSLNLLQNALLKVILASNPTINRDRCLERIQRLDRKTCPNKVEFLGDDNSVVLPRGAFNFTPSTPFSNFLTALSADLRQEHLWRTIGQLHGSPRVIRRGEIKPDSGIRESHYKVLWRNDTTLSSWITVTENCIRQSFDLERVMFSRGNVTEKIRFGALVQAGERVLDLYAGIGYFTLPALVHGRAEVVVCCEWNPRAGTDCIFTSCHISLLLFAQWKR